MAKPILGYWDFRNMGEPIRYLLHYKGIDFQDIRYSSKDEYVLKGKPASEIQVPDIPRSWLKDRFSLGLDFPNLPYYIDGDLKLTQSLAILRHLARKHDLDGKNEEEQIRVELMEQQLFELRSMFYALCLSPEFEKMKPEFVKSIPDKTKSVASFLGDRKFLAGDSLTYVDFIAHDVFDYFSYLAPKYLSEFPNLKKYHLRLKKLPELQKYFQSSYKPWPVMGPSAMFGGLGPEPKLEF